MATFNNLVVVDSRGFFTYIAVGLRGARNDKHLYNISKLHDNIKNGVWLNGDKVMYDNGFEYP